MTSQEKMGKAIALVKSFAPKYQVSLKKYSKLHKVIGWILSKLGNKTYMTDYATTIGQNTVIPDSMTPEVDPQVWKEILHEGRHAADSNHYGDVLFGVAYLFPQVLGILGVVCSLAAVIAVALGATPWLLLGVVTCLLVAPLPAPLRAWAEVRAYTVTMATDYWTNTIGDQEKYIDWLVEIFTGPGYYKMWPFPEQVRTYFEAKLTEIKFGIPRDPYLFECEKLCSEIKWYDRYSP